MRAVQGRRNLSKTRYYRCEELGHLARDCPQLKNWTVAAVATAGSDSDGDVLEISDKVSTSFLQWILDSACPYHVCCREEQLDSLENSEGTYICRTDRAVRSEALGRSVGGHMMVQ